MSRAEVWNVAVFDNDARERIEERHFFGPLKRAVAKGRCLLREYDHTGIRARLYEPSYREFELTTQTKFSVIGQKCVDIPNAVY